MGVVYHLSHSKVKSHYRTVFIIGLSIAAARNFRGRVAVPYKLHVNKLLQILRADDLCHCRIQIALLRKKKNTPIAAAPNNRFEKNCKKIFKKSVTFFIFADYIYGIVNSGKSLFLHVLSILLHRRLHRTPFCIIICAHGG